MRIRKASEAASFRSILCEDGGVDAEVSKGMMKRMQVSCEFVDLMTEGIV